MNSSQVQLPPMGKALQSSISEKNQEIELNDSELTSDEINDDEIDEEISNEDIQSRKMDKNASFFATFIDGASFRYLIEYLRLIALDGTFIFTKNYITFQKEDEDRTIFNDVKLKGYELTDYDFLSFNEEVSATLNLGELRNKTRTVGKKEQMDIYRRPGEPSNFYIQVRSQEKSSGDNPVLYCMPMKNENVTIYKLPEYKRGKRNPNVTIYQTDFSKLCKALVANKCIYAEFVGYDKGIIIKGYSADGGIVMVKEYGKCKASQGNKTTKSVVQFQTSEFNTIKPDIAPPKLNVRNPGEIEKFKIHNSIIKCLSKLNGFSPNGTIKFYIEKDAPMKAVVNIGSFGKLRILLRSSS
jgi:hypothetical protein